MIDPLVRFLPIVLTLCPGMQLAMDDVLLEGNEVQLRAVELSMLG